jgi:hypothetical protein
VPTKCGNQLLRRVFGRVPALRDSAVFRGVRTEVGGGDDVLHQPLDVPVMAREHSGRALFPTELLRDRCDAALYFVVFDGRQR